MDYTIDRLLGFVRFGSPPSDAIAIHFTITSYDGQFGTEPTSITGTNLNSLKLLKESIASNPNSSTWPLMFKNVYSLGGSNIEPSGIEVEIVRDLGGGDERTHSDNGLSYLSIFGLDSEDANHQKVDGGDGKIDLYGSLLNLTYGELILPTYLPFAYDTSGKWGINHSDLQGKVVNN